MAKIEREIHGNFQELLNRIEQGIMNGSSTSSLEDSSDFADEMRDAVCEFLKDSAPWEAIA